MFQVASSNTFDESLNKLFEQIDRFLSDQSIDAGPVDKRYMELYTLIYDHCTGGLWIRAELNLLRTVTGRRKYLLEMGRDTNNHVVGGELYYRLENYLMKAVGKIYQMNDSKLDEDLLQSYVNEWKNYQRKSRLLAGACNYFNRHYVRRAFDSGSRSTYEVFQLTMLIWREILWKPLKSKLTDAIFHLIQSYRENQAIKIELIDDIIKSYKAIEFREDMFIWIDDKEIKVSKENIYENYFEIPFLQNTEQYYQSQSTFDFQHDSLFDYLEKIIPCINNDMKYIYPYLFSSTQQKMMKLINEIFLNDHLNLIYYEIDKLIEKENFQNLKTIYQAMKYISVIRNNVTDRIESSFYQMVIKRIDCAKETAINDSKKIYLQTILDFHRKFSELLQEGYSNEQDFIVARDKVWVKIMNNDVVRQITQLPELLAQYCNELLRKSSTAIEETDCQEQFNQIIIILNYIEDKDLIENFYQEMFRIRSIDQLNTSYVYDKPKISTSENENILHFYTYQWEKYQISTKSECEKKDSYQIFSITINIWKKVFFQPLNKQITQICLNLIKSQRNSKSIDTDLISKVIQSYVALDCTDNFTKNNQMESPTLTIYKDFFEVQFLQDTEQFYQSKAPNFHLHNSVTECLEKLAQCLDEDIQRVQLYLHPSTLPILTKKVEKVLIYDQIDVIYAEAKKLLRDEKYQDLAILFKLINRAPNTIDTLKEIVENYIYDMGINALKSINEVAFNNPKLYVETIIDVHKKCLKLIRDVFNIKSNFLVVLDQACAKFINNNPVTQLAGSTIKSTELLARYSDMLLRKGHKSVEETDFDEKFNPIMIVFNYIEDKDVFLKFYQKMLAKRLIGQLSASHDYEESMILKLKQACGREYTLKLERMFQDIESSKNLNDQYQTYCENGRFINIDFSVIVLTSNSWPFSHPPNFVVPIEISRIIDSFTNFYSHQHSGRKLTWLYQHSKGELKTLFSETKYILRVSTYQMTILLLFNEHTTLIVEQIQDKIQISDKMLFPVLCTLLNSKLLICEEINIDELDEELKESDIQLDYSIKLNENFKNQKTKIDLNVPLKLTKEKDNNDIKKTIDEERKMIIQAAIVRIMKARQKLKHTLLVQDVVQQLSSRFKPNIPLIKKCIDILIEKDYLKRDSNDKDILCYLA